MKVLLLIIQIAVSIILIVLVLLQAQGSGLGTIFGDSGAFYRSKRGIEKLFVYLTILFLIIFLIFSVIQVRI